MFLRALRICSPDFIDSQHASNIKISVFQSMFLRALRICSPDFIDQVIKFIYSIVRDHHYPEHLIDDAYHRAIKSHLNSNVSRDPIQNVLTLPFHYSLFLCCAPCLFCLCVQVYMYIYIYIYIYIYLFIYLFISCLWEEITYRPY